MTSLPLLIGLVTSWDTAAVAHLAPGAGHRPVTGWVTTWTGSAMSPSPLVSSVQNLNDQTIRDIVYTSVGGDGVRIRVTNAFGDGPLTIGGASVARQLRGARLDPATTHRLTFGGGSSVRVPKGGAVLSDPVSMPVPSVSNLAVSLYAPGSVAPATYHQYAQQTNYLAAGDHVGDAADDAFTTTVGTWFLLDAVQVLEGVNDLGFSQEPDSGCYAPNTDLSPRQLITAYQRIAASMHAHGKR